MEHLIFKTIVEVENQSDCDELRNICENHELPMWTNIDHAFAYMGDDSDKIYLQYQSKKETTNEDHVGFFVDTAEDYVKNNFNIVSIQEFEELAKDYNPKYDSIDDILTLFKQNI